MIDPDGLSAAVRAFGLGQVIDAQANGNGDATTTFGKIAIATGVTGSVRVLIRPAQPRIVTNSNSIEAEVIRIDLRPPESFQPNHIAVVRIEGQLLRVFVRETRATPGDRVRLRIEGQCEVINGP